MKQPTLSQLPVWIRYVAIALLILGIVFRFVNLDHKLLWHDEVYTGLRAAGYVVTDIQTELVQTKPIPMQNLKEYINLKPGSTYRDTLRSLRVGGSQHPPLYFALTRLWVQGFGSPIRSLFGSQITVLRSLPMLLSLLAIPAAFALAWELFHSKAAALFAAMLLAISPFDVLFAQTARQYSLLTVLVLVSQWLLMRAVRLSQTQTRDERSPKQWQPWLWYSLVTSIGLYIHSLFGLTLIAQIIFIGWLWLSDRPRPTGMVTQFGGALLGAIIAFTPWLIVVYQSKDSVAATTDWLKVTPSIGYYLKSWIVNFTSLFFDLYLGLNNPVTLLVRMLFLVLIGAALVLVYRQGDRRTCLSILTMAFVPFLLLVGADVVLGSMKSTISRYLLSSYPGVQLAVAWLFATLCTKAPARQRARSEKLNRFVIPQWFGKTTFCLTAIATLTSLTVSAASFTGWSKGSSYYNGEIAKVINQATSPLLVSDFGDNFINLGELGSLSYLVKPDVPLVYLGDDLDYLKQPEFSKLQSGRSVIFFRPSKLLQSQLEANANLRPYPKPELRLWTLVK